MTSVVRINAHCTSEKEVVVQVINRQTLAVLHEETLENGKSVEKHIFDDQGVLTFERVRPAADPVE